MSKNNALVEESPEGVFDNWGGGGGPSRSLVYGGWTRAVLESRKNYERPLCWSLMPTRSELNEHLNRQTLSSPQCLTCFQSHTSHRPTTPHPSLRESLWALLFTACTFLSWIGDQNPHTSLSGFYLLSSNCLQYSTYFHIHANFVHLSQVGDRQ